MEAYRLDLRFDNISSLLSVMNFIVSLAILPMPSCLCYEHNNEHKLTVKFEKRTITIENKLPTNRQQTL
jgi:hypothetical protein